MRFEAALVAITAFLASSLAAPAALADQPAPEIFSQASDGGMRHKLSGMICPAAIGEFALDAVDVLDQGRLGRDVSCDYRADFDGKLGKLTLFVTDWGADYPESDILQGTIEAIRQRNPGAQPYEGLTLNMTSPDSGFAPARATFLINQDGTDYVTGAWIQNRLGWSLKLRLTVPEEPWQTQSAIANVTMMVVFETITKEARP